ncbi:MAG: hypothetical protein V1773_01620 [bacterium]
MFNEYPKMANLEIKQSFPRSINQRENYINKIIKTIMQLKVINSTEVFSIGYSFTNRVLVFVIEEGIIVELPHIIRHSLEIDDYYKIISGEGKNIVLNLIIDFLEKLLKELTRMRYLKKDTNISHF